MSKVRVLLSLMVVALLALGFIAGCGSSSDDGGGDSSTGTVTGTVTDQNSQPVSGALCTVTTTGAKADYSDTTDNSGVYEITSVPSGSWPLTISADGFVTQTQDVTVTGGSTTEVPDVELPTQGYGIVTGTVASNDGSGVVAGATVSIGELTATTATDGTYTLSNVPAGSQTIACTATNFEPYHGTVTVIADTTITVGITMTPVTTGSPTPSPGYGNVSGKVVDANGTGLADVTVSLQKGTATTDANGAYLMENLTPGVRTLAYAKTGYDSKTQDVTVEADTTVTATTVTLSTGTATGTTTWVSKRINLPEVNNAIEPDISNDGSKIAFSSNGNVIVNWNNPSTTPFHIYLWTRATGTITRISNNNLVSGSTAGANDTSSVPAISGDGAFVVFRSAATDILPNGLATTNLGDIFMVRLSDLAITRLSNSVTNPNSGGNASSNNPKISGDGTKVVFESLATNIGNITHTAAYSHIYYVVVTDMTPGVRRMLDITTASAEGSGAAGNPASANASISYDGRYTAFQSLANNITSAGAGVPAGGLLQIFRNDVNADPATGWNIHVSKHNGATADAACSYPAISEGGSRIAFQSTSTNLGNSSAAAQNIYLWNLNSAALTWVSIPLSGAAGASQYPVMDRTGQYVGFISSTVGLVPDVTNNTTRFYVKDVNAGTNTYTLVSRGSSDQVPDIMCVDNAISGDGNYAVWRTTSKNLTNDSYTAGLADVFVRKWK